MKKILIVEGNLREENQNFSTSGIQTHTQSLQDTLANFTNELDIDVVNPSSDEDIDKNVKWLRELLEILQNESTDPKEFMDLLRIDLYNEEIFVFTPAGDLIQLPIDSTPVDFAFQVHTQVGMHCMGAKINHTVVPLNTKLKNGDMVEIITSKKQMPSYGWQKFIVTTKARNQVIDI